MFCLARIILTNICIRKLTRGVRGGFLRIHTQPIFSAALTNGGVLVTRTRSLSLCKMEEQLHTRVCVCTCDHPRDPWSHLCGPSHHPKYCHVSPQFQSQFINIPRKTHKYSTPGQDLRREMPPLESLGPLWA